MRPENKTACHSTEPAQYETRTHTVRGILRNGPVGEARIDSALNRAECILRFFRHKMGDQSNEWNGLLGKRVGDGGPATLGVPTQGSFGRETHATELARPFKCDLAREHLQNFCAAVFVEEVVPQPAVECLTVIAVANGPQTASLGEVEGSAERSACAFQLKWFGHGDGCRANGAGDKRGLLREKKRIAQGGRMLAAGQLKKPTPKCGLLLRSGSYMTKTGSSSGSICPGASGAGCTPGWTPGCGC